MIESFKKIDYSFDSGKNWFQTKESNKDVLEETILKIKGMSFNKSGDIKFEMPIMHDELNNNLTYCSVNNLGFETFEREKMDYSYNIHYNTGRDAIISNLNNNIEKADVVVNGHSLSETAKKVDGLDIITNDMRDEIKKFETRIKLLERRVCDTEHSRMDIKSLIDSFCKEMFAGVSYDETTKEIEFWNYNKESLGGIILK